MRQLTFPGFMDKYVRQLSETGTGAIYALSREAVNGNPRLKEPLYLYALSTGRDTTLMKAVKGTSLYDEYEQMHRRYGYADLLTAFRMTPPVVPEGYQKVWRSFVSEAGMHERDSRIKELMRNRILSLQKKKNISVYNICKNLGLNNSNINAWLKNGIGAKVSIETARRIMEYTENRC